MEQFNQLKITLDKQLQQYPGMVQLEASTGVPKAYIALGVGALLASSVLFNIGGQLVCNLIGFVYPTYASFKSIESKDKDDDTHWLTYWVVFGLFNVLEFFTDILLYWMPMYFMVKTIFLVWLFLPQTRGAERMYQSAIRPFLLSNEAKIDETINKAKKAAAHAIAETIKQD
ncbi:hypothetical protein AMAG_01195 [Allomyces macrogynus ATCC 38327]|uniref:Protein YOP1 n=1 Tax=Allomyces macrogynus (strain ATCC 38327) TaxID=578462 RepID=A0A0L0RYQ5_ALLM3|nr:hypothetical protein AMAG_01195 [Allomyces macrogynus ATCC 38327]|eukprot:KNE55285.1 hypothetical protein AMAG_01195 [Allomyces macrogynus ATCC 38327]